jgi:beta-lactamase regulating signal transducer with metallopeptidase domain
MGEMGLIIDRFDMLARPLLQALLNSFWQGMVIAAMVWLLLRVIKKASATTRHAIWLVSLLTIGALPLIAIGVIINGSPGDRVTPQPGPEQKIPAIQSTTPVLAPVATPPPVEETIVRLEIPVGPVRSFFNTDYNRAAKIEDTAKFVTLDESTRAVPDVVQTRVADSMRSAPAAVTRAEEKTFRQKIQLLEAKILNGPVPMILVCVWLAVWALLLIRIGCSYLSLFRLRRRLGFVPSEQRERAQRLAEIFGIKRRVRVFTSQKVSMPMTVGSFRPVIILPPDLAHSLSDAEFESVIAHELAHIKRWDYLTNLLQRFVQASLFFHPAVWLIGKHLMIERELACDDWAVKTCEPRRYASCLTKLVALLSESRPLVAATGILFGKHVISRRVEMILNRDRNATTVVSKPALVYAIGLAVVFVCVCSLISPVIAVPLAQNRAQKQQKKESKATTNTPTKLQEVTPVPLPAETGIDLLELPETPEPPEIVETPFPPTPRAVQVYEIEVDPFPSPEAHPVAIAPLAPAQAYSVMPVTPAPQAPVATTIQRPTPAPMPAVIAGWDQDEKNRTPAIPESELLGVLTDIVKRDSDPAVRNEALQGIYRMRSDAAVNSLIQLYDGINDVKVKSEIIAYLIRRNGDNSKAIAKLMTIAKSDSSEELRGRAIRYLATVKGDEGANNLIQIYDGLQDSKLKQTVIRYLAYNKSRKAIDKLILIAKNDTDPAIRQAAIRSLYGVDGRLYLELVDKARPKIGMLGDNWQFKFEDLDKMQLDSKRLLEEFQLKKEDWLNLDKNLFDLQKNFQFDKNFKNFNFDLTPEQQQKIDELEKEKNRPRLRRNIAPAPRVKRSQTGTAI